MHKLVRANAFSSAASDTDQGNEHAALFVERRDSMTKALFNSTAIQVVLQRCSAPTTTEP